MRLHLLSGHGYLGGGEQMLLRLAAAAAELGHRPMVVGPSWGDLGNEVAEAPWDYRALPGSGRRSYALSLARYAARVRVGLVWANGALPAAAAVGTPAPLVVHLHQDAAAPQRPLLWLPRARSRAVVVPSAHLAGRFPGSYVLENWTPSLSMRRNDPGDPQRLRIGYVGRLSLDKGVDVLVRAAEILDRSPPLSRSGQRVELLLAGDSRFVPADQVRELDTVVARSTVTVRRLGWVDPVSVYDSVDMCVVPSRWDEPFGLTAAEAMAVGVPLVVTRTGALPHVVGPEHPWVVPRDDPHALAAALSDVATAPHDTVACAVGAARERWETRFSPAAGTRRLAALLRQLGLGS